MRWRQAYWLENYKIAMININFFSNRVSQKIKQKKQDARLFRFSTYCLIGVTLLMVLAFTFKFYNTLQISRLEKEIKNYQASILGAEQIEMNYLIFVNKIKVIAEIYQKRSNKQEAMNYFAETFSQEAEITGMNYQEDQGGLVLQLSCDNVFKLQKVNEILDSASLRQQYQKIEKSSLSRTDLGSYKLTLKLELKAHDQ